MWVISIVKFSEKEVIKKIFLVRFGFFQKNYDLKKKKKSVKSVISKEKKISIEC